MTVIDVQKSPEHRTMTMTAEFDVPVDRVWEMWSNPRKLERWWGPPTYPATFTQHDLSTGGRASYFMPAPRVISRTAGGRCAPSMRPIIWSSKTGSLMSEAIPTPRCRRW